MPSYYSPSQVAAILSKSPTTVRRLTALYADHLSEDATPPKGRARQYTVEDVAILKLASDATDKRKDVATIAAQLATIALPEVSADLATLPPEPAQAPLQRLPDVDALTDAVEQMAAVQLAIAESLQLHSQSMDRLADRLVLVVGAMLLIVLLVVAAAAGWIG